MRSGCIVGVIGLSLLASACAAPHADKWMSDYAAAKALARSSGKPLLVVFR